MDSPSRWQPGVLEQDVLPSTSAFVAPGQEDLFLVHVNCLNGSSPAQGKTGSAPASPLQLHSMQHTNIPQGSYLGMSTYLTSQGQPMQPTLAVARSPGSGAQPVPHLYQGSPMRMFPSPTVLSHGLDPGVLIYDTSQQPYVSYDPANQYGLQHQQCMPALGQPSSVQALSSNFMAAAGQVPVGEAPISFHSYGLTAPGPFPPSYLQQQQQQSGLPASQQQQVLAHRTNTTDQFGVAFASPTRLPAQESPPSSGSCRPGNHQGPAVPCPAENLIGGLVTAAQIVTRPAVNELSRAGVVREGGPGGIWGPDVPTLPPPSGGPAAKVAAGVNLMSSPEPSSPNGFASGRAVVGAGLLHGAVRHVVEELRTSPLVLPSDYGTPAHSSIGVGRTSGGAAHGNGSGEKNTALQRYQAQILSLERQNAELQKRLVDTHAALEAARQARQAVEAKQDAMADQVAQANHSAKSRESALETARRANDALSGELRSCQEELAAVRNALAAAKDTAVQWQDRAIEVGKELEVARKKIETLGEEERRLSSENMALRKEAQQLNDVIIKGRIESAELREKLRSAQQETARAASTAQALASRAESEQEGAATQIALMRNKVVELESRNSQLLYDMAGMREEAARARQAADAAKAALATKPAGITSDAGLGTRQHHSHGLMATGWTAHDAQPTGSGGGPGGGTGYGGLYCGGGVGIGGSYSNTIGNGSGASYRGPDYGAGGNGNGTVFGSGVNASSRPALMPPTTTSAVPSLQPDQDTAAAILRDLPSDVAFSKLDPETFRSMVRAEAEALARGGSTGLYGGTNSPMKPSYGTRYGSTSNGDLAVEPSTGTLITGVQPPPGMAWAEGPSRELMLPPPPLPDARNIWRAAPPLAEERSVGVGGATNSKAVNNSAGNGYTTGGGGGSPPYAVNIVDSSYAYRRPANAVGSGVAPHGGNSGADTPFGTEETVKEMMARSKTLEDQLMALCAEKGGLEAEYARMPLGAGRSLRERNRKQVVEQRLELLNKEISSVRMQLKRLGVK
ncbi:hypothetical protein VaNZ11_000862 [Volvox africanus]|uniref:Uncharacterized protein n=1 Tax=Volvox africanus TaxID=51714 RepID=A0ABQ5RNN6_9CHLO|nr:hypothetical protein VaNZ11_000862 [Volvox africanus]